MFQAYLVPIMTDVPFIIVPPYNNDWVSLQIKRSAADVKKIDIQARQSIPSSIACSEMYILSKDNKLCYFLAKTRVIGIYNSIDALLVNKSEAVQFCKFHSNGTLPYGKLKNGWFQTLFLQILKSLNFKISSEPSDSS